MNCIGEPPDPEGISVSFPVSPEPFQLKDGAVIDGSFSSPPEPGNVGAEASWHFEAQRE